MTERENYLIAARGGKPEWIPLYFDACQWFAPECIASPLLSGKTKDVYGIPWTQGENGAIPTPGAFIMEDICDWREKVTIPFELLEEFDWEASIDRARKKLDPNKAVALHVHSVFNVFVNAMGFENALIAIAEDPEEVYQFFETLSRFQEIIIEKSLQYYDFIDIFNITDDVANARTLFMSPSAYMELIHPFHKRQIDAALSVCPDILVEMHCCGKCDMLIDQWYEDGVTIWQPAQTMNDLAGIQAKYGNKLVLNGCWDTSGIVSYDDTTEETIRKLTRETIDKYGKNGAFVFWDSGGTGNNAALNQKLAWDQDEARKYGADYYK